MSENRQRLLKCKTNFLNLPIFETLKPKRIILFRQHFVNYKIILMARFLSFIIVLLFSSSFAFAQSGELQGKVTDADTGEGIPFANVAMTINGSLQGAQTDFDGFYSIKPVPPGSYDVQISFVGYQSSTTTGVIVSSDKITFFDIGLQEKSQVLEAFVVTEYKKPLFEADETSTGATVTKEDIANLPTRNVQSIASQAAGVYQSDEGGSVNVKGSRDNATDYYIDGIKVRGSSSLPKSAIEQLTVVTGGVPARYGDATGGIINITTRGPSNQYNGGVEVETSKFLDPYGYYLGNFTLTGPLAKIKKGTPEERALMGFILSTEYLHQDDDDPSAVGIWKVKDDVLQDVVTSPLLLSETSTGFVKRVDLLGKDDFEQIDSKLNVERDEFSIAGKVDIQPIQNINFTVGGTLNYSAGGTQRRSGGFRDFMRRYELFNWEHEPEITSNVYRIYGRITQRFTSKKAIEGDETSKASAIQNAFYSIQFDYTKSSVKAQDPIFQDNLFNYGYVGQFNTFRRPEYAQGTVGSLQGWELQGFQDTLVTYSPYEGYNADAGFDPNLAISPERAYHNLQYFDLAGSDDQNIYYSNIAQIRQNNGMINGSLPASLFSSYSLWYVPGFGYGRYQVDDNAQYRLTFNGSFDIKRPGASERNKHAIEFGFEYEQRVDRNFGISPTGLWDVMFANTALPGRDILRYTDDGRGEGSAAILVIDGNSYTLDEYSALQNDPNNTVIFSSNDTITYNLYRPGLDDQGRVSFFDANLREKLGVGDLDFIDIHAVNPDQLSLDMLSPDELFNGGGGASLIDYYGYDHTGQKSALNPSFRDFWTAVDDETGIKTRPIDAFRPVYMAGYVQDKFAFKDLIFNVGVRVDRFDANQQVPRDQYVPLYATHKAGDDAVLALAEEINYTIPSTVDNDFVVYVDDEVNPGKITGFRDGDQWYDVNGQAITDPSVLEVGGSVNPYLSSPLNSNPEGDVKEENYDPTLAFQDYEPQITVMPRVAFSFNISEEAVFFANYSVLSQRPQGRIQTNAYDYYYFAERSLEGAINNPNLQPERTIDYQIGFKQKISNSSALTVSAFYRELKDMVQVVSIPFAYPSDYTTYGNRDFGTVKGLEFSYDMRRTKNIKILASYTLQFAEGTGSGDRSQVNLVNFGIPNLRTIFPLSYDSRHMFNVTMDYSFGEGKDYNGPKIKNQDIFANTSLNMSLRARSGEPYSRQSNATPEAQFGVANRPTLEGSLNGSRLPWNFRVDMRLQKDFKLNLRKKEGKSDKYLNVFLQIQNLLNKANIINVYEFTGSASDDGFVTSSEGRDVVAVQTDVPAFIDQYQIKVNNPNFFSSPRTIRLGAGFSF